jgi:hypothetical protein
LDFSGFGLQVQGHGLDFSDFGFGLEIDFWALEGKAAAAEPCGCGGSGSWLEKNV